MKSITSRRITQMSRVAFNGFATNIEEENKKFV